MSTVPALPPGQSKAMTSGTTQVVLDQNHDDMLYEVVDGQVVEKRMGPARPKSPRFSGRDPGSVCEGESAGSAPQWNSLFRIDVAKDLQRRPDVAFISNLPAGPLTVGYRTCRSGTWSLISRSKSSARAIRRSRFRRRFTSISRPE